MNTKTDTSSKALAAALTAAENEHAQAIERLAAAERASVELRERNQAGDTTVTGMDLVLANAEAEAARGLAAHSERAVHDARAASADALAAEVAKRVRRELPALTDLAAIEDAAAEKITNAPTELADALTSRDAASDAAGRDLAAAGIAEGEWRSGVRYLHGQATAECVRRPGRGQ